jgi:translation initiation factor eIF-2B subunit epsilon
MSVAIRNDVRETGVYICNPGVPPAYSDNFDYQTHDDFVKGIISNEEILGNTLYAHVTDGYAARADSVASYCSIMYDYCERLIHPIVPEQLAGHPECIKQQAWNIYRHESSKVDRNAKLSRNVMLGANSVVEADSVLECCYIGDDCKIGKNVVIRNSQIWNESVISVRFYRCIFLSRIFCNFCDFSRITV